MAAVIMIILFAGAEVMVLDSQFGHNGSLVALLLCSHTQKSTKAL